MGGGGFNPIKTIKGALDPGKIAKGIGSRAGGILSGQNPAAWAGGFPGMIIGGSGALPGQGGSADFASGGVGVRPKMDGIFNSQLDPDTNLLKQPYQLQDPGGRVGLDALTTEATRTGPSAWANLQRTQQLGDIAKASAGAQEQGRNMAAMTGGLSTGASERMNRSSMRDKLMAQQGALGGIARGDEDRRYQALRELPGAELAEAGFRQGTQQYNIDQALREHMNRRGFDMAKYREDMKGYAAERTAAAAPQDSGGFSLFDPGSWF